MKACLTNSRFICPPPSPWASCRHLVGRASGIWFSIICKMEYESLMENASGRVFNPRLLYEGQLNPNNGLDIGMWTPHHIMLTNYPQNEQLPILGSDQRNPPVHRLPWVETPLGKASLDPTPSQQLGPASPSTVLFPVQPLDSIFRGPSKGGIIQLNTWRAYPAPCLGSGHCLRIPSNPPRGGCYTYCSFQIWPVELLVHLGGGGPLLSQLVGIFFPLTGTKGRFFFDAQNLPKMPILAILGFLEHYAIPDHIKLQFCM